MLFCVADVALSDIPTCLMMFTNFKIGGSLVGNAGFSASTCFVASLSFSCGVAVSMGEAGKTCKTAMIKGLLRCSRFMQIRVFTVLRRLTFWLCSVARGHQAFTVNDMALIETVQDRCSKVTDRDPSKFRMDGSVADSGMKFVSNVERVAEML